MSYYRNMDLTWELTKDSPRQISQPTLFVAGERDGVILMAADALKELDKHDGSKSEQTHSQNRSLDPTEKLLMRLIRL